MSNICYLCFECWAMNDPSKPSTYCKHFKAAAKPKPKPKPKVKRTPRYTYEIKVRLDQGEELWHFELSDDGIAEAVAFIQELDWMAKDEDDEFINDVELNIWDNREHWLDWERIHDNMHIGKRAQKKVNKFIQLMNENNLDIH